MNNLNTPQPYYDPNTELDPDMIDWATAPVPYTHNRSWATIAHDTSVLLWSKFRTLDSFQRYMVVGGAVILLSGVAFLSFLGPILMYSLLLMLVLDNWEDDDETDA